MSIGEAPPFACQPVDVRCLDLRGTVAADVSVADVVGQDDDDVWSILRCFFLSCVVRGYC